MTDDRPVRRPADPSRVELKDAVAVDYWINHFDTSRQRLEEAIQHAGQDAEAVGKWLEHHPELHAPPRVPRE